MCFVWVFLSMEMRSRMFPLEFMKSLCLQQIGLCEISRKFLLQTMKHKIDNGLLVVVAATTTAHFIKLWQWNGREIGFCWIHYLLQIAKNFDFVTFHKGEFPHCGIETRLIDIWFFFFILFYFCIFFVSYIVNFIILFHSLWFWTLHALIMIFIVYEYGSPQINLEWYKKLLMS